VPGVGSKDALKDALAVAERLYRGGDATRGLPACGACHGPDGGGNAAAGFPRVSGQNADYVANQLRAYAACGQSEFKNCDRGGDGKGQIMSAIAATLTQNEIQALASYVSGLQ
jgi:cytochrome c553